MSKLENLVVKLQGLVNNFGDNGSNNELAKTSEELMRILEAFQATAVDKNRDNVLLAKINSCALTLWNLSVAMRNGKKTNSLVNAKARHVACHLTFFASSSELTESSFRRKLPLALKTGKAWLDCSNMKMAENCFILAIECWTKLQMIRNSRLTGNQASAKDEQQIQECEKDMLKLYAYRAEVAFTLGDDAIAKDYMTQAKDMLEKYPHQSSLLATYCYNFGVEHLQKGAFENSIGWLRESYEIGKGKDGISGSSPKIQATCLRHIAKAYLEIGGKENAMLALNSADLSIAEESNPRSFYLKLKILLQIEHESEERKASFVEESLSHSELKIDLGIQILKLLIQNSSVSLITKASDLLTKRFQRPQDGTKIQMENLEYLLENRQPEAAKELIRSHLIAGVKQLSQADSGVMKKFHLLVWEQASTLFEADQFEEALIWYDFSYECFSKSEQESKNVAKLQRNRASCLLGMKQYSKAQQSIEEAYKLEADCAQTYFVHFKICLASIDDDKALNCIEKLGELALENTESSLTHGFICLAAQMAFQEGNKKVAVAALEKIIQQAKDPKQILTALRCLTRLKYTYLSPINQSEEVNTMLGFVKKAYETLQAVSPEFEAEIQWFVKIAWNLGLTCQDSHKEMFEFFVLCFELSQLIPDKSSKAQQKTCLLMAAAAGIETVKMTKDENEKMRFLNEITTYVQKCEKIFKELVMSHPNKDKPDPTLAMLVCLEFEAKARLGYSSLDIIIEKAKSLSHVDARTFETMSATAFSLSPDCKSAGIKAIKIAIKYHLDSQETDYIQLSKDLHTLVNVSMQEGSNSNAQSKEEAFQFYQYILEIIQKAPKNSYPEMETLWLMTKAWNCGVYLFSAREHEACERWCGMAMKLLDQLDSLKSNYDTHMTSVFADMLERRERIAVRNQMEE
eukprot:Seg1167.7 transcript_id=Seg1167.7/GoldUCD/mRNA.D3Y31 product="Testis-expressed protein 11" protein_id=Seg1167.7/GoldUCD/D3Y31